MDELGDGPANMARDLELLSRAESGVGAGRVYRWDGVWVSLGRSQAVVETLVHPDETPWVRRPTGGGAVLHGHDVTVALAMPVRRGVSDTYRLLTRPILDALAELGFSVARAEDLGDGAGRRRSGEPNPTDCFAVAARCDLVDTGTLRKVCGCALRRTRNAALLQASIPAGPTDRLPQTIIRGGVETPYLPITAPQFAEALKHVFETLAGESRARDV